VVGGRSQPSSITSNHTAAIGDFFSPDQITKVCAIGVTRKKQRVVNER
jgi:hypothetical protein